MDSLRFPIAKAFLGKKGSIGIATTFKTHERPARREIDKVAEFPDKKESGEG